uniref:Uncharacterized protein n=1 Tax=Plectus sambesii TaxID=2011161 RepID=A0A914V3A8_9BILA
MAFSQRPQHALQSNAQETPQEDSRRNKENNYSFTNDISGGRNVSGAVQGGIVVLGDYHASGQASSPSPPTPEELKKMLER